MSHFHGDNDVYQEHIPVLADTLLHFLSPSPHQVYVDGTLGLGGHAVLFLQKEPTLEIVGFDLDTEHLELARKNIGQYTSHASFIHDSFGTLGSHWGDLPHAGIDLCLFDLGLCSRHVDHPEKGFSFQKDGPLDMRFNKNQHLTAKEILHTYSEQDLAQLFFTYGEEPHGRKFARAIVTARETTPLETTLELAALIEKHAPRLKGKPGKHPATRVFQALRIAVNDELAGLESGLTFALEHLNPGGRIAVISYHSLEDRIVKTHFQAYCPKQKHNKYGDNAGPAWSLLTKTPYIPTPEEIAANPRARSAKLRVIQRNY